MIQVSPTVILAISYALTSLCLTAVIIAKIVQTKREREAYRKEIDDLRDRLMARDFTEYVQGSIAKRKTEITKDDVKLAEELLGMDENTREEADRLPVV